jgi:hypothetical protein
MEKLTRRRYTLEYKQEAVRLVSSGNPQNGSPARAKPLLDSLRLWLENTQAKLSVKSDTAGAIRYALSRWRALTRYADDGTLEIDNNAAERALRVVALGRKNYLFAGSDN